jgi:ABC-type polysaccharide/polyol phosphate export permease
VGEEGRVSVAVTAGWAELWRFRELVVLLVSRDLKVRYKRSVLGMLWTLLNPLLQMSVYALVFSAIVRVGVRDFPVYLLAGLLPWQLVSVSGASAAHALLANQGLIRKVAVPQAVYPLALVGSKVVDLVLSLGPLGLVATAFGHPPGPLWILLLPAIAVAAAFAAGLSLLFASANVFFRDVRHLVDVLFQVWFYLTPILWPASYLERLPHPALRLLLAVNPAAPIVGWFQAVVHDGRAPAPGEVAAAVAAAAGALALGYLVFRSLEDRHVHWF